MAELLKNVYNNAFFNKFIRVVKVIDPSFNEVAFLASLYDDSWEEKALKQRMRHISICLKEQLTKDYSTNINFILQLIPELEKQGFKPDTLEFIFLPDFVEIYGRNDFETSIKAIEIITQFVSCEFAVRPFIQDKEKEMVKQLLVWSKHKHASVRRLASEGCRPRLPWGMALNSFKENPEPIIPILAKLKKDTSEYVRRSVANNLNDIAKDHPERVLELANKWFGNSKETDALVKHGCRTLLKKGNTKAMNLFGFGELKDIHLKDFKILSPVVKIGNHLEFSFSVANRSNQDTKIRLEYAVYFLLANNKLSKKVFKISEKIYLKNSTTTIIKKHSFRIISTRKFYTGIQEVGIILNGIELDRGDFNLE